MSSWETEYRTKLHSADEALRVVQSGMRVYIQPGCAEPETLVEALPSALPSFATSKLSISLRLDARH